MKVLFTTTNWPMSWLIRWGLGEPVSHVMFVFGNHVIESKFTGIKQNLFSELKANVIYELDFGFLDLKSEDEIWCSLMELTKRKARYDWGAFLYFGWRAFLKKFFGKEFPKKNPLGSKHKFLCTELVEFLPSWIWASEKEAEIITPFEVFMRLRERLVALKG